MEIPSGIPSTGRLYPITSVKCIIDSTPYKTPHPIKGRSLNVAGKSLCRVSLAAAQLMAEDYPV